MEITLTTPDDLHVHFRDGAALTDVVPHTAKQFSRAIVMPNLAEPITTVAAAQAYRQRIIKAIPKDIAFEPLMTLYLTDTTSAAEIQKAVDSQMIHGVKLYPAGATTNSDNGVTDIKKTYAALAEMEKHGMPLLIHGEIVDDNIDVFDREKVFIERILIPLLNDFPKLRMVFEHITTQDAVEFVTTAPEHITASITAHHLLLNRNAMLVGGIHPHHYCLPVLKRETHRLALINAATNGNKKFFAGTDSAPHTQQAKESSCGCAGIFSAPVAIETYAEIFAAENALSKLEAFCSFFGADFYKLPRNSSKITLKQENWTMQETFSLGTDKIIPFRANENISWKLLNNG